jgi:hypothetical protein
MQPPTYEGNCSEVQMLLPEQQQQQIIVDDGDE